MKIVTQVYEKSITKVNYIVCVFCNLERPTAQEHIMYRIIFVIFQSSLKTYLHIKRMRNKITISRINVLIYTFKLNFNV